MRYRTCALMLSLVAALLLFLLLLSGGEIVAAEDDNESGGEASMEDYYGNCSAYLISSLVFTVLLLGLTGYFIKRAEKWSFLLVVGVLLMLLGCLLFVGYGPSLMSDARNGEGFDQWLDEDPAAGDRIVVAGYLAEKNETPWLFGTMYVYRLEGSENGFLSSRDLGVAGDYIIVKVQMTSLDVAESSGHYSTFSMLLPGIVITGMGLPLAYIASSPSKPKKGAAGRPGMPAPGAGYGPPPSGPYQAPPYPASPHHAAPYPPRGPPSQSPYPGAGYQQPPAGPGSGYQPLPPRQPRYQPPQSPQAPGYQQPPVQQQGQPMPAQSYQFGQVQCPGCFTMIPREHARAAPSGTLRIQCPNCGISGFI